MNPEEDVVLKSFSVCFDDLEYYVVCQVHQYRLAVAVYQVFAMYTADMKLEKQTDGRPYLKDKRFGSHPVTEPDVAEVLFDGAVKWDGCSDWNQDPKTCFHFCEKQDAVNLGVLLGRLYDLAAEHVPHWSE